MAAGILASRLAGLVRQRFLAQYLGLSDAADVFNAALRIPNVLQNLFGEGALSASFIPVYAGLLGQGRREEADRLAGAVGAMLALVVSAVVLAGVLASPALVAVLAPGFTGAKRDEVIVLVRILFPGTGLLVMSAWCLGILNSHGRFLLSYAAPVIWNAAIIAALVAWGGRLDGYPLARVVAWGAVMGSALQLAVQLPGVRALATHLRFRLGGGDGVRTVVRNFLPSVAGRGVVQVSAYVDQLIASLLPAGAVAALANAQLVAMLPVSLFGMAVAAAELPAMSRDAHDADRAAARIRERISAGLERVAFFVVPSALALAGLGHVVAGALFQTGRFTADDSRYVWGILGGAAIGLLATTMGRLYSSGLYALQDARTPFRFAVVRVGLTIVLGFAAAVYLPGLLGVPDRWGAAGLTAASSVAGWVEFALLRRALTLRVGAPDLAPARQAPLWGAGALALGAGWAVLGLVGLRHPLAGAVAILGAFAATYLAATAMLGVPTARAVWARVAARRAGR